MNILGNSKQELIVLIGISGSGKSTLAKKMVDMNPSRLSEINRDEARTRLYPSIHNDNDTRYYYQHVNFQEMERKVTTECMSMAQQLVDMGDSLIISDTNTTVRSWKRWVDFANKNSMDVSFIMLDVPLSVALQRDKNRKCRVGEMVIRQQLESIMNDTPSNHFNYPVKILNMDDLEKLHNQIIMTNEKTPNYVGDDVIVEEEIMFNDEKVDENEPIEDVPETKPKEYSNMEITNLNTRQKLKVIRTRYPAGEIGFLLENDENSNVDDMYEITVSVYNLDDAMELAVVLNECSGKFIIDRINIEYLGFGRQDSSKDVNVNNKSFTELGMSKLIFDMIFRHIDSKTKVFIIDPHNYDDVYDIASEYDIKVNIVRPTVLYDNYDGVIFPDEGASKRYGYLRGDNTSTLTFKKKRGDGGNITFHELDSQYGEAKKRGTYVIIDDICDGGATFISIAKAMRTMGFEGKLVLQISHGLFTKGLDVLYEHFDGIKFLTDLKK